MTWKEARGGFHFSPRDWRIGVNFGFVYPGPDEHYAETGELDRRPCGRWIRAHLPMMTWNHYIRINQEPEAKP